MSNNDLATVENFADTIDPLRSSLLISQVKKWIDENKFNKLTQHFSCQNENDILAEFFFLISNFYSSQSRFQLLKFLFKYFKLSKSKILF